MVLKDEIETGQAQWRSLTFYRKFEHVVILFLIGLIAVVIIAAIWNLALKVLFSLILSNAFDPADHATFQVLFGMILTVIIALEFKRSLLVAAERERSVVQVRAVVLIAMLAVIRKLIIFDYSTTDALQLLALAAAALSLGGVYWLVRDQDRRERG